MRTKTVSIKCCMCDERLSAEATGPNHKASKMAWEALWKKARGTKWRSLIKWSYCPKHSEGKFVTSTDFWSS